MVSASFLLVGNVYKFVWSIVFTTFLKTMVSQYEKFFNYSSDWEGVRNLDKEKKSAPESNNDQERNEGYFSTDKQGKETSLANKLLKTTFDSPICIEIQFQWQPLQSMDTVWNRRRNFWKDRTSILNQFLKGQMEHHNDWKGSQAQTRLQQRLPLFHQQ